MIQGVLCPTLLVQGERRVHARSLADSNEEEGGGKREGGGGDSRALLGQSRSVGSAGDSKSERII